VGGNLLMLDNRFRPSSRKANCSSRGPTLYVKALKEYKMLVFLVEKGIEKIGRGIFCLTISSIFV